MQAVLYNKKAMEKILNGPTTHKRVEDMNKSCFNLYYKEPLVYQIFNETESYKQNMTKMSICGNKLLKLNKTPEPGTTIIYRLNEIYYYYLLIILFIYIINKCLLSGKTTVH